jgi:flagella basal body P-ring formation protein FlgA
MSSVHRGLAALIMTAIAANASAADLSSQLKAVRNVLREGQGNEAAAVAVRTLSAASASDLSQILAGFEGASPLAANYLRNAVEAVADRHLAAKKPLPAKQLEAFVLKRSNDPRARRLAF